MLPRTLVLAIAIAMTAPLVSSSGSYSASATLAVTAGVPQVADSHIYEVAASTGDDVDVVVSWASSTADLDIRVIRPDAPTCPILPDPDAVCIVELELSRDRTCASEPAPAAFGPATETRSFTATGTGTHGVIVMATLAAPQSVAYDIEITVTGAGGSVSGPQAARFLGGNAACKLP